MPRLIFKQPAYLYTKGRDSSSGVASDQILEMTSPSMDKNDDSKMSNQSDLLDQMKALNIVEKSIDGQKVFVDLENNQQLSKRYDSD